MKPILPSSDRVWIEEEEKEMEVEVQECDGEPDET